MARQVLPCSRLQFSFVVLGVVSLGAHRMTVITKKMTLAARRLWHCLGSRSVTPFEGCYLVDPASSHMLVSKIKPCMCKYELIQTVKLRMAH